MLVKLKKVVFGRLMRHINPTMCRFGALDLYLLCRFNFIHDHLQMDLLDNERWFDRNLLCAMPQNKGPSPSTSSSVTARIRVAGARTRARIRTSQCALVNILPPMPIQHIGMLPHTSVVTQFSSAFQGVPTALPHAPFLPLEKLFSLWLR